MIHMTLSKAAERYDVINKQQARMMTVTNKISQEWNLSCQLFSCLSSMLISYRYLQFIMFEYVYFM
jgi:hypothetical protein